jgi:hypothetical protein
MLLLQVRYEIFTTEEKNRLWKLVLKKVSVYRSQDDELSITLQVRGPMFMSEQNKKRLCSIALLAHV